MVDGHLHDCPDSPNCVSTAASDEGHKIAPIAAPKSLGAAWDKLKADLAALPRVKIIESTSHYISAEATSLVMRFIDDVEFLRDDAGGSIHVRSASRLGWSDIGVNRSRIEELRQTVAESQN